MRPGGPDPRSAQARPAGNPQQQAQQQARAAAMAGAVDLAAVKARSDAAARAAEAPPPAAGSFVIDVTEGSFQTDVLDRSFQVPVLLDLWADWCEPCKQLSPILERLANAAGGSWILGKIDIEANQRLAQALQVQSIPAVFAVIGGQLVPGFQGALPEAQVREFVDAVLEAGAQAGLQGGGAPPAETDDSTDTTPAEPEVPEDPRFTAAEQALEAGDFALATSRYEAILAEEPRNTEASLALGQVKLMQRLEGVDRDAVTRADAAPDDVEAQLAAADLLLAGNDVQGALDRLLAAVARTNGEDRDRIRERLVEFFDLLGPDDPRVATARRQLARALF